MYSFELYDHDSNNLLQVFRSEGEALRAIAALARANGAARISGLALNVQTRAGEFLTLGEGAELIEWALDYERQHAPGLPV